MKKLFLLIAFLLPSAHASRIMIGPAFPWHDWFMIAYQGPSSIHQKAVDIYIQNISSVVQTLKINCEFRDISHSIGNWGFAYTPVTVAGMDSGASIGPNKFQRTGLSLNPNDIIKVSCFVNYSSQQDMDTNFRDVHQKGVLFSTVEVDEDRGAIVAYMNSRTENFGSPEAPKLENNGAISEPMLRNISKTFFFNGGRAF